MRTSFLCFVRPSSWPGFRFRRGLGLLLMLGLAMPVLTGCDGIARTRLGDLVAAEFGRMEAAPSRITTAEIDACFREVSAVVLEGAKAYDAADDGPSPELDVYDRFDVVVVRDPLPNAWTFGDDFATVSSGSLAFVQHPDELAFLLAHEFGHMYRQHMLTRLEGEMSSKLDAGILTTLGSLLALGGALSEDQEMVEKELGMTPKAFFEKTLEDADAILAAFVPHKQEDEFDADRIAVHIMAMAGLPLDRCGDFLRRAMTDIEFGDDPDGTHPPPAERLARIEELVRTLEGNHRVTRRLSPALLTAAQASLRDLEATPSPAFYFQEVVALKAAGADVTLANGCGPLLADQSKMIEQYNRMVGR